MGNNSSSQQASGGTQDELSIAQRRIRVQVKADEEEELGSEVEDCELGSFEEEVEIRGTNLESNQGSGDFKSDMYEDKDEDEVVVEKRARRDEKWIKRERKRRRREERGLRNKGGWSVDEGGVMDTQVSRVAEAVPKRTLEVDGAAGEVVERKRWRVKGWRTSVPVDLVGEGRSGAHADPDLLVPEEIVDEREGTAEREERNEEDGEQSEEEQEGEQTADGIVNGAGTTKANASDLHEREKADKQPPSTPDPSYARNLLHNDKLQKITRQKPRVVARLNSRTSGGGPYMLVPSTEQAYKDDQLPTPPYGSSSNGKGQGVGVEEDQACGKPSRKRKKNRGQGKSKRDEVCMHSLEEPSKHERSKKRKPAQIENEAPDDEYQLADTEIVRSPTKKRKRGEDDDDSSDNSEDYLKKSKRKSKRRKLYNEKIIPRLTFDDISDANLPTEGPFVKVEVDRLERFVRAYREQNDMTTHDVNVMIQDLSRFRNTALDEMWDALFGLLPHRRPVAVRRTCRRRFHNYLSRGKWNAEEDEELRKLYVVKPNKWTTIGEMLSRMPEDCRDRWRNYLSCGSKRNTDDWTEHEEHSLRVAVQACVQALRKDAIRQAKKKNLPPPDTENDENFLNFNIVSEKMGHTRSRLQCSTHWRRMERRGYRQQGIESYPATPKELEDTSGKNRWRHEQAKKQSNSMEPGDKYAILYQIASSGALDEGNIPWKCLHRDDPKWTVLARKEAFKRMKKLVDQQDTLQATVKALLHHFESHHRNHLDEYWELSNGTAWAKDGEAIQKAAIISSRKAKETRQKSSPTGQRLPKRGVKKAAKKALLSADRVIGSSDQAQFVPVNEEPKDTEILVQQSDNEVPNQLTEEHGYVEATPDQELQARVQQWSREISGHPESDDGNGRDEQDASLNGDDGEEDEDEQLRQQSVPRDAEVSASSEGEMDEQPRVRQSFRDDVEEEVEVSVDEAVEQEESIESAEKPRSYWQNVHAIEASPELDSEDEASTGTEDEREEMVNDDDEVEVKSEDEDSEDGFERSTRATSIILGETEGDRKIVSAELGGEEVDIDDRVR